MEDHNQKVHPNNNSSTFSAIQKSCYVVFNIYICKVQSFNHYCVHYNLTHKHKGTQWGEGDSDVEDHYLNVYPSYFNGNSTRK